MNILVVGDVHFSQYSSILRKRGKTYSFRIENLIESINWAENLCIQQNCERVVYLGDFFDKPELVSEEITALKEIKWSNCEHIFLCGNHELMSNNRFFNSANTFLLSDKKVISSVYHNIENDVEFCYLPYVFEENRYTMNEYFGKKSCSKRIIFSHNDIKGFQMGSFLSTDGFDIDDIKDNCDLYLNGHLHNGGKVCDGIINVGNLTGQNFSEDAFNYDHSVIVLDTDNLSCAVYTNPYAINFYRIDFSEKSDIDYINQISMRLKNAVVSIKCKEEDYEYLNKRFNPSIPEDRYIPRHNSIVECRFIIQRQNKELSIQDNVIDLSVDHVDRFQKYILEKFGDTDLIKQELIEVCKG